MSFLELYNEDMYDLLSANEDMNKLRLYEDPMVRGSVIINGIEDVIVTSKEQVLQGMSWFNKDIAYREWIHVTWCFLGDGNSGEG